MSLKTRITKLNQQLIGDDETFIVVHIGDDSCSVRKPDCQEYPCKDDSLCWYKKKYPKMKTINVGVDEEEKS